MTGNRSGGEGPRSISGSGVAVAGSVFNPVKREAALAVVAAIVVAALSERVIGGALSFVVLVIYGVAAGAWIFWRSRQVLARQSPDAVSNPPSVQSTTHRVVSDGQEQQ